MFLMKLYRGPWRLWAPVFITVVAVGGYFVPAIGLAVPVMILLAMVLNARQRRLFCSHVCPNGRTYSGTLPGFSKNRSTPRFLTEPGVRKILCAFMFFCVINFLARSGGGLANIGRVFWGMYLMATGLGFAFGLAYKPRSWCVVCPMGTLQDTVRPVMHTGKI